MEKKVLTAVKNNTKQGWGLLVVGYWLDCTILPTTHNSQPTLSIAIESKKKEGL